MADDAASCYIALGSNLSDPVLQVSQAAAEIATLPDTELLVTSRWYRSEAVGPGHQPDYINGVVAVRSRLSAPELLQQLQSIEHLHHRKRLQRWGPRTLDLDLLYYGGQHMQTDTLTLPHPRILERNFVLYPLLDVAPDFVLHNGEALKQFIQGVPMTGLQLVDDASSPTIARDQQP